MYFVNVTTSAVHFVTEESKSCGILLSCRACPICKDSNEEHAENITFVLESKCGTVKRVK